MVTNRILDIILTITSFVALPVLFVTQLVLSLVMSLPLGWLLLFPISLVWAVLFLFPMTGISWFCNKVPVLREVLGIVLIPWALVAHTFVALIPSLGEPESRVLKLMLCCSWPYTWEFQQFQLGKIDLKSTEPVAVALKVVVNRMCLHNPPMQRVLMQITRGQAMDAGMYE